MKNRGVVVEIAAKNKVIVMTAQGEFIKVPFKKHVQVGQEIRYAPKKERLSAWQMGLAATLFLALVGTWPLLSGNLAPSFVAPAFVITLDINPSLEMQISADQQVLSVEGLNRDGQNLASRLDVVGHDLRPALAEITDKAEKLGYIKQGQNQVVVTIASQQEQNATLVELKDRRNGQHVELEKAIVEAFSTTKLAQVRVWQVPRSLQTEAKLAGIVPSRYIAIQMPETPVIPQRFDTKLTMNDPPEVEEVVSPRVRTPHLANAEPVRPALTPTQWTKQASDLGRTTGLYNMNFSIVAVKGDL